MDNLTSGSLEIKISKDSNRMVMTWLGQSDARNPSVDLNPYLDNVVSGLKNSELLVKFDDLEYMNSSTVPPIIQFLKKLNTSEIKTLITYDSKSKWQAASFKALETFSGMLKFITVKAN